MTREEKTEGGTREEKTEGGTREEKTEGGTREEPGAGGDERRSRAQPGRWPTEEPMEGGAMVEKGLMTPGGRLMEAEPVVRELRAETESR